jgi:hypothetical protein
MLLKGAFVVLHLIVWDADTGLQLWPEQPPGETISRPGDKIFRLDSFAMSGNRIEDCRMWGVEYATKLSEHYRNKGFANAFTNVDCEWVREPKDPGSI